MSGNNHIQELMDKQFTPEMRAALVELLKPIAANNPHLFKTAMVQSAAKIADEARAAVKRGETPPLLPEYHVLFELFEELGKTPALSQSWR